MSQHSLVRTQFASTPHLLLALADVSPEFGLGKVREGGRVQSQGGRSMQAELVVGTRNVGHDLGFVRREGVLEMLADWWGIRDIDARKLDERLRQRYAYHVVRDALGAQGFRLSDERSAPDRSLHLHLERGPRAGV